MAEHDAYVFQYDVMDDGTKRPLRSGIITLEMPQTGGEKLRIRVHADALSGASGLINRFFVDYAEGEGDEGVMEISAFPIPSFPLPQLDEFLCSAYGKEYASNDDGDGHEYHSAKILTAIDVGVFFDARDSFFARLDTALYNIVRVPGYTPDHSDDIFIKILLHIDQLASKLPKSWSQSLANIVSYANSVTTHALAKDRALTFPAEVTLHPSFKLLRESTREKIAWSLLQSYHLAWQMNSRHRKTASLAQICNLVNNQLVPRFIDSSHEFVLPDAAPGPSPGPSPGLYGPGPAKFRLPIRYGHRAERMSMQPYAATSIQLYIEGRTRESSGIVVYILMAEEYSYRTHVNIRITYIDGTIEEIVTPSAGTDKFTQFPLARRVDDIIAMTGTVRVEYCCH